MILTKEDLQNPYKLDRRLKSGEKISKAELQRALLRSCQNGLLITVEMLLNNGADPNEIDDYTVTVFKTQSTDAVDGFENFHYYATTPLQTCVMNDDVKSAELLLSRKADPDLRGKKIEDFEVKMSSCPELELLSQTEDFSYINLPPLHMATRHGHKGMVELLLKAGAKQGCLEETGEYPIHIATREGHCHLIRLFCTLLPFLVDRRTDQGSLPGCVSGRTSLFIAGQRGHIDVTHILVDAFQADMSLEDDLDNNMYSSLVVDPCTLCNHRELENKYEICQFYLARRVKLHKVNLQGHNCLDLAVKNGYTKIATLLRQVGLRSNLSDDAKKKQFKNTFEHEKENKKPENANKKDSSVIKDPNYTYKNAGPNIDNEISTFSISEKDQNSHVNVQQKQSNLKYPSIDHLKEHSKSKKSSTTTHITKTTYWSSTLHQKHDDDDDDYGDEDRSFRSCSPQSFRSEGRHVRFKVHEKVPKAFDRSSKRSARKDFINHQPVKIEVVMDEEDDVDVNDQSFFSLPDKLHEEYLMEKASKRRQEWQDVMKDDQENFDDPYIIKKNKAFAFKKKMKSNAIRVQGKLIGFTPKPYRSFGRINVQTDKLDDSGHIEEFEGLMRMDKKEEIEEWRTSSRSSIRAEDIPNIVVLDQVPCVSEGKVGENGTTSVITAVKLPSKRNLDDSNKLNLNGDKYKSEKTRASKNDDEMELKDKKTTEKTSMELVKSDFIIETPEVLYPSNDMSQPNKTKKAKSKVAIDYIDDSETSERIDSNEGTAENPKKSPYEEQLKHGRFESRTAREEEKGLKPSAPIAIDDDGDDDDFPEPPTSIPSFKPIKSLKKNQKADEHIKKTSDIKKVETSEDGMKNKQAMKDGVTKSRAHETPCVRKKGKTRPRIEESNFVSENGGDGGTWTQRVIDTMIHSKFWKDKCAEDEYNEKIKILDDEIEKEEKKEIKESLIDDGSAGEQIKKKFETSVDDEEEDGVGDNDNIGGGDGDIGGGDDKGGGGDDDDIKGGEGGSGESILNVTFEKKDSKQKEADKKKSSKITCIDDEEEKYDDASRQGERAKKKKSDKKKSLVVVPLYEGYDNVGDGNKKKKKVKKQKSQTDEKNENEGVEGSEHNGESELKREKNISKESKRQTSVDDEKKTSVKKQKEIEDREKKETKEEKGEDTNNLDILIPVSPVKDRHNKLLVDLKKDATSSIDSLNKEVKHQDEETLPSKIDTKPSKKDATSNKENEEIKKKKKKVKSIPGEEGSEVSSKQRATKPEGRNDKNLLPESWDKTDEMRTGPGADDEVPSGVQTKEVKKKKIKVTKTDDEQNKNVRSHKQDDIGDLSVEVGVSESEINSDLDSSNYIDYNISVERRGKGRFTKRSNKKEQEADKEDYVNIDEFRENEKNKRKKQEKGRINGEKEDEENGKKKFQELQEKEINKRQKEDEEVKDESKSKSKKEEEKNQLKENSENGNKKKYEKLYETKFKDKKKEKFVKYSITDIDDLMGDGGEEGGSGEIEKDEEGVSGEVERGEKEGNKDVVENEGEIENICKQDKNAKTKKKLTKDLEIIEEEKNKKKKETMKETIDDDPKKKKNIKSKKFSKKLETSLDDEMKEDEDLIYNESHDAVEEMLGKKKKTKKDETKTTPITTVISSVDEDDKRKTNFVDEKGANRISKEKNISDDQNGDLEDRGGVFNMKKKVFKEKEKTEEAKKLSDENKKSKLETSLDDEINEEEDLTYNESNDVVEEKLGRKKKTKKDETKTTVTTNVEDINICKKNKKKLRKEFEDEEGVVAMKGRKKTKQPMVEGDEETTETNQIVSENKKKKEKFVENRIDKDAEKEAEATDKKSTKKDSKLNKKTDVEEEISEIKKSSKNGHHKKNKWKLLGENETEEKVKYRKEDEDEETTTTTVVEEEFGVKSEKQKNKYKNVDKTEDDDSPTTKRDQSNEFRKTNKLGDNKANIFETDFDAETPVDQLEDDDAFVTEKLAPKQLPKKRYIPPLINKTAYKADSKPRRGLQKGDQDNRASQSFNDIDFDKKTSMHVPQKYSQSQSFEEETTTTTTRTTVDRWKRRSKRKPKSVSFDRGRQRRVPKDQPLNIKQPDKSLQQAAFEMLQYNQAENWRKKYISQPLVYTRGVYHPDKPLYKRDGGVDRGFKLNESRISQAFPPIMDEEEMRNRLRNMEEDEETLENNSYVEDDYADYNDDSVEDDESPERTNQYFDQNGTPIDPNAPHRYTKGFSPLLYNSLARKVTYVKPLTRRKRYRTMGFYPVKGGGANRKDLPPQFVEPGPVDFSQYGHLSKIWMEQVDRRTVQKSETMYLSVLPAMAGNNIVPAENTFFKKYFELQNADNKEEDGSQWVIARGRSVRRAKRKWMENKDRLQSADGSYIDGSPNRSQYNQSFYNNPFAMLFFKVGQVNWPDLAWVLFDGIQNDSETVRMITDIRLKCGDDVGSQIREVMARWWTKKGEEATIEELQNALEFVNIPFIHEEDQNASVFYPEQDEVEEEIYGVDATGHPVDNSSRLYLGKVPGNDPDVTRLIQEYDRRSPNASYIALNTSTFSAKNRGSKVTLQPPTPLKADEDMAKKESSLSQSSFRIFSANLFKKSPSKQDSLLFDKQKKSSNVDKESNL